MIETIYWAAMAYALGIFDCWFTARRLDKFGVEIEQNEMIKLAVKKFGMLKGLFLAKMLPYTAMLTLFVMLNWHDAVVFIAGAATLLTVFQLLSIVVEDKIYTIMKATGQIDANRPPSPVETETSFWVTTKVWLQKTYEKIFPSRT